LGLLSVLTREIKMASDIMAFDNYDIILYFGDPDKSDSIGFSIKKLCFIKNFGCTTVRFIIQMGKQGKI